MDRDKHKPFLLPFLVSLSLAGCADFQLGKEGGVVSGCVDTTSSGECKTPPGGSQSVPSPSGEERVSGHQSPASRGDDGSR